MAKRNNGAPGVDGVTFEAIEEAGLEGFLERIRNGLVSGSYRPMRNRRKEIPKGKDEVVTLVNPILRGWVSYFRVGHSSRCFEYVKDWVEKKVRRHIMSARGLHGFGWDRWSKVGLYGTLGLYDDYRVRYYRA